MDPPGDAQLTIVNVDTDAAAMDREGCGTLYLGSHALKRRLRAVIAIKPALR